MSSHRPRHLAASRRNGRAGILLGTVIALAGIAVGTLGLLAPSGAGATGSYIGDYGVGAYLSGVTYQNLGEGGSAGIVSFDPKQTKLTVVAPRPTDVVSSGGSDYDVAMVQLIGKHPGIQVFVETKPLQNPFTASENPVTVTIWLNKPASVPISVLFVVVGISDD